MSIACASFVNVKILISSFFIFPPPIFLPLPLSLSLSQFLPLTLSFYRSHPLSTPSMVALPIYVTPQFTFAEGTGKFNIKLGPKQTMGKNVSHIPIPYVSIQANSPFLFQVKITIPMPKCVTNVNPTCTCE